MGFDGRILLFLDKHSASVMLALLCSSLCIAVWNIWLTRRIRSMAALSRGRSTSSTLDGAGMDSGKASGADCGRNEMGEAAEPTGGSVTQNIGLVRFDAFDDIGGEQSFALALLNDSGSGVVLSNLSSRSESRMYAKRITFGKPEHALSSEEQEAVKRALECRPMRRS